MIIYNPHNQKILEKRLPLIKSIFENIKAKHVFITGSFINQEKYKDIDIFVISRRKKITHFHIPHINITIMDFNDLHSLFYHSLCKSCISKNILPTKSLKVTLSDYWRVINEAVPTILNQKTTYQKEVRFLLLYTKYFKTGEVLDTFQLNETINRFKTHESVLDYVQKETPRIMNKKAKKSYLKKFFYTQAGFYTEHTRYNAQNFLYNLAHTITRGL
ncbi:MAG: hypothetical protein KKG60_02025 [Nanoarchaeota archaeon]|nr:hypothetical protein [Nanoarchaeota archaeon]